MFKMIDGKMRQVPTVPQQLRPPSAPPTPPGTISNNTIIRRNGGIVPMFVNDIGGCSANYR
jgi:hypothetical protein